ncbi:MAG: reverse transcriptase family protein [Acidimicrobiia bacterium]
MSRRPTHLERVAAAVAAAYLAGDWDPPAMGRRAKRALGTRRHWPTELARTVRHEYPERPADRPRELAGFIRACQLFVDAVTGTGPPLRIHIWMVSPTEMGSTPWPVPAIPDLTALAGWLGVTPDHLDWFADRRSLERRAPAEQLRHYHRRWVGKADGSSRLLEAPKRELKDLQRQVLHQILDHIPAHPAAHGFRPGCSVLTGASRHTGRAVVVRLDLEAFFASVTAGRVYGIFRRAGYPEPVAHALTALCTTTAPRTVLRSAPPPGGAYLVDPRRRLLQRLAQPHLAQGSPTSPALANLAAFGLDRRLTGLAGRLGADYTRYADDLILSGDRSLVRHAARFVDLVRTIAADEGFQLHETKTRVQTAAQRQTVTGVVVNRHPNIARTDYDRLRAVLHDAATSGPEAANRAGHPDFRAHLLGRISWMVSVNPTRAGKLEQAFAAIHWPEA